MSPLHRDERSGHAPDAAAIDELFATIGRRPAATLKAKDDWIIWLLRAVTVFCFAMAFYPLLNRSAATSTRAVAATTATSSTPKMEIVSREIQYFDVGMRAVGKNPDRSQVEIAPEPDAKTSRKLVLRMKKESGRNLSIKLIRPINWIEELGISEGGTFFLDLPEMGAVGDAHVEQVLPCPEIQQGPGNVVTGVFAHEADPDQRILRVEFANGAVIEGVTDNHPFWAVNRNEFVPVGDLHEGERVQVRDGTTTVTHIESRFARAGEMLYNLETHNEHVYQVTTAGVLVHNNCVDDFRTLLRRSKPFGGHARPLHTGRNVDFHRARLANNLLVPRSSAFLDDAAAARTIMPTIKANQGSIRNWLRNSNTPELRLNHIGQEVIGTGLVRGSSQIRELTNARIVLRRDPNASGGWFLLTAFPE